MGSKIVLVIMLLGTTFAAGYVVGQKHPPFHPHPIRLPIVCHDAVMVQK